MKRFSVWRSGSVIFGLGLLEQQSGDTTKYLQILYLAHNLALEVARVNELATVLLTHYCIIFMICIAMHSIRSI